MAHFSRFTSVHPLPAISSCMHPTMPYASVYPWAVPCRRKRTIMQCRRHISYQSCPNPEERAMTALPAVQLDDLNGMTFKGQIILLLAWMQSWRAIRGCVQSAALIWAPAHGDNAPHTVQALTEMAECHGLN